MEISEYIPVWGKLTPDQQAAIVQSASVWNAPKGTVIQRSGEECVGMLLIRSGQLRSYLLSDDGREITLYRLFDRDVCLFSASCLLQGIQFDITIEAEKDTELWVIPANVAGEVIKESAPAANYINELMASHFSEVMWLVEQILWKSFDKRLADFLLEESTLEGSRTLTITHETIGKHLGTAREVVTRMLRYFQNEGLVELNRGHVVLVDEKRLRELQNA